MGADPSGEPTSRYPITGVAACCAWAAKRPSRRRTGNNFDDCLTCPLWVKRRAPQKVMSALPSKVDMCVAPAHVCRGPESEHRLVRSGEARQAFSSLALAMMRSAVSKPSLKDPYVSPSCERHESWFCLKSYKSHMLRRSRSSKSLAFCSRATLRPFVK